MDNGNQLLADAEFDYVYDAEGNLNSKTERLTGDRFDYTWDHRNRLVQVTRQQGTEVTLSIEFTYDALDRRVGRRVDADGDGPLAPSIERFLLDGDSVWSDLDGAGNVTARYLQGTETDELLARWRVADGLSWYLTDHLGSVREIVNSNGVVVDSIDYDAFGRILSESNPAAGDRYKFTGREWEAEIELYFYRARYYDASAGRFINRDPIGFDGGDGNLYRYVENSPVNATDPTGNTPVVDTSAKQSRIVLPLVKGFTCVGKGAAEKLPELVLTGGTGYHDGHGCHCCKLCGQPCWSSREQSIRNTCGQTQGR